MCQVGHKTMVISYPGNFCKLGKVIEMRVYSCLGEELTSNYCPNLLLVDRNFALNDTITWSV